MVRENAGLREAARELLGIDLNQRQLGAFSWYAAELIAWNRRFNLTAITDPAQIEIKHFLDSLTCLLAMGPNPEGRLVDVGTGAGFPGLPLKIAYPQLRITLVESTGKKASFCRHVAQSLRLENVLVVHARAERVGHWPDQRQKFDWAVARAVAAMPVLA